MNASRCKCEQEVLTALRSGTLGHELDVHVTGCVECSEVMFVVQFLQRDADSMGEISIPDANLVWRRALSRSRAEDIARAICPIQWVVHASIAVTITAALWLILGLPAWLGRSPLPTSSLHVVSGMWVFASFVAGAVTILSALFGVLYILRVDPVPVALVRT